MYKATLTDNKVYIGKATQVTLLRNDSITTNPVFKMNVTKIAPPFRPTFGKIRSLQQTSIGQLS